MEKIGFIGMGIMGKPMALNVLAGGFQVMAYNRTAAKVKPLEDSGAKRAGTPAEVGQWADDVILMLTGPDAIDAVLEGEDGLFGRLGPGKTVINMSTVPPSYSRSLGQRIANTGAGFIDAPVSGSKVQAEQGILVILAGGDENEIQAREKLFGCIGKQVVHCGQVGDGSTMKMVINLLLAVMMAGFSEAIAMGERCGLETEAILEAVLSGAMACPLFKIKGEMAKEGKFPPQFPLKHMEKDLGFILHTAEECGIPIPVGREVWKRFNAAMQKGFGDQDFAAVKQIY